jgi:integrase
MCAGSAAWNAGRREACRSASCAVWPPDAVRRSTQQAGSVQATPREEDVDLDGEKIVRVRRQVKNLGRVYVFALPKNDRERIIPLSDWDIQVIRRHTAAYPLGPYTLPWEKPDGKAHTCKLLFRWSSDDRHIKARSYSETVWKPAAVKAGLIPEPKKDKRGRLRYATTRKEGIHQLRHYFASVMLAGGVFIKELAEYLGHADPAFTLRVYANSQELHQPGEKLQVSSSQDRRNGVPLVLMPAL